MRLIDSFIECQELIDGGWYIAKPYNYPLFIRVKHAIQIVKGYGMAVKFKTDDHKRAPEGVVWGSRNK